MNYYDELLTNIDKLLQQKRYDEAKLMIQNELNLVYIPKDVETKLNEYLSNIKEATYVAKSLSDDEISSFLYDNNEKQLIAVNELDKKNLREYIEICSEYLKKGTFKNSKALLIDSLIRQEVNREFEYVNDSLLLKFNPSLLKPIEKADGFIAASNYLNDVYMKTPSMLKISMDLLYKECILYLPKQANENEGIIFAKKIVKYIDNAFSAK